MSNINDYIEVYGARVHNLKNIDVKIPKEKLVVITGLSGSGKSSLAFDTIYAEGQRRYMETFSAYARQFLGAMERPDVDKINGLSPVISIEQKTINKNLRSTVGTVTEIYDFLRLLYARVSKAYSYVTQEKMVQYSDDEIINLITREYLDKKITILAPVIKSRKGHYRELFEKIGRQGFNKVRINGKIKNLESGMTLNRYKTHDIEIVIDRLKINNTSEKRLVESTKTALYSGEGIMMVLEYESDQIRYFSRQLMCPKSGISYPNPEPNTFSFNSSKGACPKCKGLGVFNKGNEAKIIPNLTKTIYNGGIEPIGKFKKNWIFNQLAIIGERYGFTLKTPIKNIPEDGLKVILQGGTEKFNIISKEIGITQNYLIDFEGIIPFIENQYNESNSSSIKRWAKEYIGESICTDCNGQRLKKESLHFKIEKQNISDLAQKDLNDLSQWFKKLENKLTGRQGIIAKEILKEIQTRIQFLLNVGLEYLSLNRNSKSLSGGESQRIHLATQIGTQLVGVLYILDEPSIGLHQRDNQKLIDSLIKLRDIGNSIIVVEHDKDIMEQSDYIIDIGHGAGIHGGEIVSQGTIDFIKKQSTLTASYLKGYKEISVPNKRRKGNGLEIILKGASGNNLKNINVSLPLGKLICVTGVSGSGKSTLINETLYPILKKHIYNGVSKPMPYKSVKGLNHIDKVISIDQSPIGRTTRSNPATYTGVFNEIRNLFVKIPESQVRGYKAGRFSFNVKGGRCEACKGGGLKVIEMNFLPDVYISCQDCQGKRFNRETLEIRYKNKSISDVLKMTINQATNFFEPVPKVFKKLKTIKEVGLGYITLGQPSTTLSGGEAQRIKLATELSKKDTGNTFYILDEPTTGLHFEDIRVLMKALEILVNKGNTVLIIEHNLDVIKLADHIIDIGKEGGEKGGKIIAKGTPEEIINNKNSYTAKFLKKELHCVKDLV